MKSCNTCNSSNQCVLKSYTSYCTDECTGSENCGGTTNTTKDDRESAWHCNPTTESCNYQKKQSSGYDTQAQCESQCVYCRYCRKWGGFFGAYGCYGIKKCTNNIDECTTNAQCNGETTTKYTCNTSSWTCSESSNGAYSSLNTCQNSCVKPSVTRYSCNTSNWRCSENPHGAYSSLSTCSNNCRPSSTTKYSCNTSNWTCYRNSNGNYSSLNTCNNNCQESSNSTTYYSCDTSNWTCSEDSNGNYSSRTTCNNNCQEPSPGPQPCMINYFELPSRAWVDYPITGRWSASVDCDGCDVDCTPYPECVWTKDDIGIGGIGANEYKFTLSQSGTYNYTLTCYGEGGMDERTEIATVEALNLPWWREIIPVLQGFLGGAWR